MMDSEQFRQIRLNFGSALKDQARVHMETGEDTAAGILLVLERRVYQAMVEYDVRCPPGSEETPTPPKRRGRPRKGAAEVQTEIAEEGSANE